jgi:hypothetical protein
MEWKLHSFHTDTVKAAKVQTDKYFNKNGQMRPLWDAITRAGPVYLWRPSPVT